MNYADKLISILRERVEWNPRPGVLLSGGLDSTILLHHLNEIKSGKDDVIHTYTVGLAEENEFDYAEKVAKHYGTIHRNIVAKNILTEFLPIIPKLDKPRFNLWIKFAYEEAKKDSIENIYVGEGLDEHFGGYEDRAPASPQETWGNLIEWSLPTHRQIAKLYGINLHIPFLKLPLKETIKYWRSPHETGIAKIELKRVYRNVIPEFVITRKKKAGRFNWEIPSVWEREIQPILQRPPPKTHEEANYLINVWVTHQWLEHHRKEANL